MDDNFTPKLKVRRNKGVVTIKITFGSAQEVGSYQVLLQDGNTWIHVAKGNNTEPPTTHAVDGDPANLDDRLLRWDLVITVLQVPGEYDATVEIVQDGSTLEKIDYHGSVPRKDADPDSSDNPVIILDMRRVVVE